MFRRLFERSHDATWLLEPMAEVFVDCNAAAVELMRAGSRERLLQAHPAELSPELQEDGRSSRERTTQHIREALEHGSTRFEWVARRLDGTLVPLEVGVTAIEDESRTLIVVVSRDITERRRAEETLREHRQLLASVTENLREAVYRSAPDHTLTFVNAAWLRLFGFESLAEARSMPRERLYVRHADRARILGWLETRGMFANEEIEFARRDGGSFWGLMSSRAVREPGASGVAYHVGSIVDITERKRDEAALKLLNARLEDLVAERTAALQVSNQLLRDEIAERERREKVEHAVFRIAEAIHQAADLEQLYPFLHEAVGELMRARNFFIALHDPASDLHHFVYHRDEMDPPPAPRKLAFGLTAHVFQTGKALLLNRAAMLGGVELAGRTWRVEHGTPSAIWLGAALVARGRILGVMAVQDYHDETVYGEEEKRLLSFIAEQAALAIERKRAEQALRDSEERHRALFEGSSQGVMLHDDRRIIAVNTALCRMFGFSRREEFLGKHPRDTSAPIQPSGETAEALAARHISEAFERGQTRFEWMARRRDGHEFPIEVLLTTIQWGSNRIIQAVINDISERKRRERVERALYRISESVHEADDLGQLYPLLHRIVSELMPAENFFIALSDPANEMVAFPYWRDVKDPPPPPRRSPRGLTGVVLREGRGLLVSCEDFAEAIPVEEGTWFSRLGFTAQVGSGTQPLVWLGVPLSLQGQTIGAMVLQSYDNPRAFGEEEKRILGFIAEQTALAIGRKRAEMELRRALQREQELGRMKSSFTSLVSHEFRTPLGVIASSAEILRDYFERLEPAERLDHLETITKHTRRMGALMEEVLLLSRFDAGKTEFRAEALDLGGFSRRVADEVSSATHRRCPVSVDLASNLPVAAADERLLRHILTNLLVNASKYSDPGSVVELVVRREGGDAVFEVRDRGIGIPEADRAWLFQAFQRGSNVGNRPGTGLGLVIVKRCVDLHQGHIEVESTAGLGTVMRVRLPLFASGPVRPPGILVSAPES